MKICREKKGLHPVATLFASPSWCQVSNEATLGTDEVGIIRDDVLCGCSQWLFDFHCVLDSDQFDYFLR